MDLANGALITDLYQLNMMQAYFDHGQTETAVFEFFVRSIPPERRGFLVAAGLEQALEFLENLRFSGDELEWLERSGRFSRSFLDQLASFRFTGDVHAMQEGTLYFPNEPILRVTAPLAQAQLAETRLINILHFQSLIASKAARHVLLTPGKVLVDFGLRRAHGVEAGVMAARASYIAGYAGTATMLAGKEFGIPLYGTMAHSFIQAHDDEAAAFEGFARSRPHDLTLLIDTYDTEEGARKVVAVARRLRDAGIVVGGVRLDSGDLIALSKSVRLILDDGGLNSVKIFASGGIDEEELAAILEASAPIDGFGIGTSLTTSYDLPALDCAYKLQEYAGIARRKRSAGKATWPGRKQVWRCYAPDGRMEGDTISLDGDDESGEPLIQPVMRNGKRLGPRPGLDEIRARTARDLARLPEPLRRLQADAAYRIEIAQSVRRLASEVDRRLHREEGALP
jgi:nicotinate phosphoribosyltransferase